MADFQPPPTWAPVILESINPATGQKIGTFNPVWIKWFVDLTENVSAGSSGAAMIGDVVGPVSALNGHLAVYDGTTGKLIKDGGAPITLTDKQVAFGSSTNEVTGSTNLTWDNTTKSLAVNGTVSTGTYTVATLPTVAKGFHAFVTDATQALTAGIGAVVAGGGANNVPVVFDGTNWRIG